MEAILFTGLQGSCKSSFFKERFFDTHVRISLDLVRTRNRENRLVDLCLETQQRFVVDNTNASCRERQKYIERSKQSGFRVIGYYFRSRIAECVLRNQARQNRVPELAILSTAKRLEIPSRREGFDELWYVFVRESNFVIEEWKNEV